MNETQKLEQLIISEAIEKYETTNRVLKSKIGEKDIKKDFTRDVYLKFLKDNNIKLVDTWTELDVKYFSVCMIESRLRDRRDLIVEKKLSHSKIVCAILNRIKWEDELSKSLFFNLSINKTNLNDNKDQANFRVEFSNLKIKGVDLFDDFHAQECFMSSKGDLEKINLSTGKDNYETAKNDIQHIKDNEYIIVYRGFNTRVNKRVRKSQDKNNKDYYKQLEGSGFSFTLDKHIAFSFSWRFQHQQYSILGDELAEKRNSKITESFSKIIGHATIGRYLVKRSDIVFYTNQSNEREIILNDRKAKLIDYKLLSDRMTQITIASGKGSDNLIVDIMDFQKKKGMTLQHNYLYYKKHKDLWINKNWKSEIKITNKLKSLFN